MRPQVRSDRAPSSGARDSAASFGWHLERAARSGAGALPQRRFTR